MSQSKAASLVEAVANITVGFIISVLIGRLIYPVFGYEVSLADNAGLTAVFTVAGLTRSYLTRRFFNWLHMRKVTRSEG